MDKKMVDVASSAADSIHQPPLLPPQSATEFMLTVRTTFKDKPEVHDRFVDLMKSFQTKTIEVTEVIGCVARLFRNYPALLDGFNTFLPASRRIYIDSNVLMAPQVHQPVEKDSSVRRDVVGTTAAGMPVADEPVREVPSLEFQNALNYVRKIKNRFRTNPEKYNEFLAILQPYQNGNRKWSETDVFSRVSRLFENQDDLLREFAVLLPEAGSCSKLDTTNCRETEMSSELRPTTAETSRSEPEVVPVPDSANCQPAKMETSTSASEKSASSVKEPSSQTSKKRKLSADNNNNNNNNSITTQSISDVVIEKVRTLPSRKSKNEKRRRTSKEKDVAPIDLSQCERVGTSYRAVPPPGNGEQPQCGGRTALCRQVLNVEFVSVPVWREDGAGATPSKPRRSAQEERTFSIEDQRFELDLVIETNLSLMKNLNSVWKRMQTMSIANRNRMKLDDSLGGGSPTLNLSAIRRLYGDKAADVMDGLKNSPAVCVPLVLKRLKDKDEEWRRAQMDFNKVWRKDNDKFRAALKALG